MDALTVVRGLLAGLAATGAMTLAESVARTRWGLEALLDWQQNQTVAGRLLKRPTETVVLPGLGFHFLHGLLAGAVFALVVAPFLPVLPPWVLGPGYGVVLFAITLAIHKPITGRPPRAGRLGSVALLVSFVAHVVYGGTLAFLVVSP